MGMTRHFTDHPASVGESYTEHFRVAAHFARCLTKDAGAAAVHAVVPSMCKTTASECIRELYAEMNSSARGHASADAASADAA